MKKNFYNFLILFAIISSAYAQLIENLRHEMVPNNIYGQLDFGSMSLFDPERVDIQKGFSMSMMSMGKQSVSVAGYTNKSPIGRITISNANILL